jgi:hypothetical protein
LAAILLGTRAPRNAFWPTGEHIAAKGTFQTAEGRQTILFNGTPIHALTRFLSPLGAKKPKNKTQKSLGHPDINQQKITYRALPETGQNSSTFSSSVPL